ncbi:MAG: DNA repair protein RecN [Bacteroidales bacterium]|jgi:DNA repair protein RecN (Recombination protein N)|nr:DNA repair protein RecN [Bacteroidales bacterium]
MLNILRISNYALIEHLEIIFNKGFSSVTGETGAGKSIMLGALSLLMGKRADSSVLKDKTCKSIIEAEFFITPDIFQHYFDDFDIDFDEHTIIRREILPYGKTRAFINDTPVQLSVLKTIGELLLDIHSQHHNLFVKESQFQLSVIDAYAQNSSLLQDYAQAYKQCKIVEKKYTDFLEFRSKAQQDFDYYSFRLQELEKAQLNRGEQEQLEQELQLLEHGEEIKRVLADALYMFQHEDVDMVAHLQSLEQSFTKHASVSPEFQNFSSRISQVSIELSDIVYEIERYNTHVDFDPSHLESIQQRLNEIYTLQQKFSCATIEELLNEQEKLAQYVSSVEQSDMDESSLKKERDKVHHVAYEKAKVLTERRRKAIALIEPYVCDFLHGLGMPSASFSVHMDTHEELFPHGADKIKMLFSANKNITPQWLGEVASGGEISRIMLCLKTILAQRGQVQTIIFDEIDTGVSGEIADKMGDVMAELAKHMQVIVITHVPQIAAKSTMQFKVFKNETSDSTITNIIVLSQDERINEIAKMISGKNVTPEAIKHAKGLLQI